MSERHIEMFWRCSSCQHRNLGRHQVCQQCKNPKDGSEQYEMPEDTASAATVTDEALLRMATAGPNWRCAYCDSDQRAFDGGCKNCGASAVEGTSTDSDEAAPSASASTQGNPEKGKKGCGWYVLLAAAFGCCCLCIGSGKKTPAQAPAQVQAQAQPAPAEVKPRVEWTKTLQVKEVSWEHSVDIERYQKVAHEGFEEDRPDNALDVRAMGSRHHHDDQVRDGYTTVYYTEQVKDGYTTEKYKDREACGETCTTSPRSCKETCTSSKNGFAKCKTTCSGGERSCSTRYCSVTKERKVPRYVDKRRSRQEPRYRTVPRDAPWYAWNEWEWAHQRTVEKKGNTLKTRWPKDSELAPPKALRKGEKERSERDAKYRVVFAGEGQEPITYQPATLEEFQRFTPGSTHTLQNEDGKLSVISSAPEPAPPEPAPVVAPKPVP